jgi:carbonic anhydrase/acetyltransferase-like protein (isoleucine patch superfamily)
MAIYRLGEYTPTIHPQAWVADSADIIGRVEIGPEASVWFNVTIRGDNDIIRIGAGANVQDNSVLHTDAGLPLHIGERVTVGHQVMLHGCTIGDGSLIGIQAVVLNGAKIGRDCLIGAGALVTEGKEIPDRSMVLGSPGKIVRTLTDEDLERLRHGPKIYTERARLFRSSLVKIG